MPNKITTLVAQKSHNKQVTMPSVEPKVRLRLAIHRNELATTSIWWTVSQNENLTVAGLLSRINDVVPLESSSGWGLEDYVVNMADCELLHYQYINDLLHQDDLLEWVTLFNL